MLAPFALAGLLLLAADPAAGSSKSAPSDAPSDAPYDLVIYGGTSAAVTAAIQATADGLHVVVVSPDEHLGGLSSGGLGWTDSGRKEVIGGLSRQFYQRLKAHYDDPAAWTAQTSDEYFAHPRFTKRRPTTDDAFWVFEPSVAEATFEAMIAEAGVPVHRGKEKRLDRDAGVLMDGPRIVSLRTLDGGVYAGRMFLDATYEGDLMAAAGVPYTVGRESNAKYDETINGVQTGNAVKHQFPDGISPYVVAGDPSSGLLPGINAEQPPPDGTGDHRVQAYNFRMCLTDDPANRVPFPKPDGYDPQRYELLGRVLDTGWRGVQNKFDPAPNRKTDTNNHGAFSTDFIGQSYDYPEASYERRDAIVAEHERYQKGLMWFLANDPRVPADVREQMAPWGLAADEFADNGHWPHQIYVREARRMLGPVVMTERMVSGFEQVPDSIGMGSYNMDSHNVQRYVKRSREDRQPSAEDEVRNEGDVQISPRGSYPIAYGAIVPPKTACTNLTVPCAVSASHIAFGSIRMEPVFMILGQSAAAATAIALEQAVPVQDVPYEKLEAKLLALGQVLDHETSTARLKRFDLSTLDGYLYDTEQAARTGGWKLSAATSPHIGRDYYATNVPGLVTWEIAAPRAGDFEIRVAAPTHPNRATDAEFRAVATQSGLLGGTMSMSKRVNLREGELFKTVGFVSGLKKGDSIVVSVKAGTDGYTTADAVQLIPR